MKYRELFGDKSEGASTEMVYSLVRDPTGESRRLTKEERADLDQIPASCPGVSI